MSPFLRATLFEAIGLWSAFSIWKSFQTGIVENRRGWNIDRRENPGGFWLSLLVRALFVAYAVAVLLWAFGLIGDPYVWLHAMLPSFFR